MIKPKFSDSLLAITLLAGMIQFTSSRPNAALPKTVTFKQAFDKLSFTRPVYMGEMPGKPEHFIVLEQHLGRVVLVRKVNAVWTSEEFLKIEVMKENETGLLGFAFHPKFAENHKYYLSYNPASKLSSIVEEREASTDFLNDSGKPARQLLIFDQPFSNHNGGTIAFGPKDKFLYLGFGDGGSGGDPQGNGQKKNTWLGKMLRIDVDNAAGGKQYGIPSDNPVSKDADLLPEIYAYGLRNPWKWSFDALTGDLWVGDVGQDAYEEVGLVTNGANLGWKTLEGLHCYNGSTCPTAGTVPPIIEYSHSTGSSVTGGYVYRGNPSSPFYGAYFYADFERKWVQAATIKDGKVTESVRLGSIANNISSFASDDKGNLYILGMNGGSPSPIYLLESPDMSASLVRSDRLRQERAFACCFRKLGAGYSVNDGFGGGTRSLSIHSPDGKLIQSFTASQLKSGAKFKGNPGVYLIRAERPEGILHRTLHLE